MRSGDPSPVSAIYARRAAQFAALAAEEANRSRWYSHARLGVTIAGLAIVLALIGGRQIRTGMLIALAACVSAFLVLAVRQDRIERRRASHESLAAVNREALHRLNRDWNALPPPWSVEDLDGHPYAADLDVFGHASLIQILGPVHSSAGRDTLARWLLHLDAIEISDIAARTEAVRELAPLLDLRQQFTAIARTLPARASESQDRSVQWMEAPSWLPSHAWVSSTAVAIAASTLALLAAQIAGAIVSPLWLLTATAGWILRWRVHDHLEAAFFAAEGERTLRPIAALAGTVMETRFQAPALCAIQHRLQSEAAGAQSALRQLERLVALADLRRASPFLYLPVQTLTLWELHVWGAIERWRTRHGRHVRDWQEALGTFEALSSLASLAHDHPDWAFATVSPDAPTIAAKQLGHPLLGDDVRVTNDVEIGPIGRFLLITGSNMSGKSTLVRAVGLSVVLAHVGAPACASRLTMPLLALHACLRVTDSLERGWSLFMASLVRLQSIVHAARKATPARPLCYLLDEVLQGTNTAERRIAVRTVLAHLTRCSAFGIVTTHDLELAADQAFLAHADSAHLQETIVGEGDSATMEFDYRLRPGPATSGNALRLLKMLGLDSPESPV